MNIIYDTNAFLYLFEIVNRKGYTTPTVGLDKSYLIKLAKNNAGYISSVTLFEILMQCIERNPTNWYLEFEDYFNFQRDFFINYPTIINEKSHMNFDFRRFREFTDEDIRSFFSTKIVSETEHLFILLVALIHPIEQLFLEYFGRKINEEDYSEFGNELNFDTKKQLKQICLDRYSGEIDNQKFDITLNSIVFNHLYKNLCYLAENYPIDAPKLKYLQESFPDLANKLAYKICNSEDMIFNYEDISDEIKILNNANIQAINGSNAFFLKIKNTPQYQKLIKPSKSTLNDGIQYIKRLLVSYEKYTGAKARKTVEKQISDIFLEEPFKLYSNNAKVFLSYIAKQCIQHNRRLHKNDVGDYLIATMPDYFCYGNVVLDKNAPTIILSFDKVFIEFLSQTDYYNLEVYSNIFTK